MIVEHLLNSVSLSLIENVL